MWVAGHGAETSLPAPAGSNACKDTNPEDASTLRMEMWKRGKASNTYGVNGLGSSEENSKPTPPALPSPAQDPARKLLLHEARLQAEDNRQAPCSARTRAALIDQRAVRSADTDVPAAQAGQQGSRVT